MGLGGGTYVTRSGEVKQASSTNSSSSGSSNITRPTSYYVRSSSSSSKRSTNSSIEKKYNVKIEEKKVDLKVNPVDVKVAPKNSEGLIGGDAGLRVAKAATEPNEKKQESAPEPLNERLSPTLGMVAKEEDVNTLLEGEKEIDRMAKEGSVGATIYMGGKVASLWAEDIMTKVKETLPLEDKGPVIGGKTVGEQIENAAGMLAGALPFVGGALNEAIGTAIMAAEGKGGIDIKKTGEYIVEGGKKQVEYVKEEPVGAVLLFAAPEAKGIIETAIHPQRIPMHALIDTALESSTKRIPAETGRLEAYNLIKDALENKPLKERVPGEDVPEFKRPVRDKTVYHATSDVSPFTKDIVEVQAPNAQGIHTGGLYVGPEIYKHFLFEEGGKPGTLIIEHKGVSDYPAKIINKVKENPELSPEPGKTFADMKPESARKIWESLDESKKEVYLEAKEHVENTPGELVVSPQSTSGIGYRQYEVEGIITPGTKLIRARNVRSKIGRKGEYFMKVGGRHVELLHFGMESETIPYTLSELYRLKAQGAVEFAKSVGRTAKRPFERVRDVFEELRNFVDEDHLRKAEESGEVKRGRVERAKDTVEDVNRAVEDLRRDFLEDIYREEVRRGLKRPQRSFEFGFDLREREVGERNRYSWRTWRDFDIPSRFEPRKNIVIVPRETIPETPEEWPRIPPVEPPETPRIPPGETPEEWPRIPPVEPPETPRIPPGETPRRTGKNSEKRRKYKTDSDFLQNLDTEWEELYGYTELKHRFPTVEEMLFGKKGRGFAL